MSGFTKIYLLGGLGGFQGADGINPITLQILVSDGGRRALEPHYFDYNIEPIWNIRTTVPKGPNDPDQLLDACIAFAPFLFRDCPSLPIVIEQVLGQNIRFLDFDLGKEVPEGWSQLRKEARKIYKTLNIFEAVIKPATLK
jgi:hypothetical protein